MVYNVCGGEPNDPHRYGAVDPERIETMQIQYKQSTGRWGDPCDATEKRIAELVGENGLGADGNVTLTHLSVGPATAENVVAALEAGREVDTRPGDWYAVVRKAVVVIEDDDDEEETPRLVKCDCGHSVPSIDVMSASLGMVCSDCYDEWSN